MVKLQYHDINISPNIHSFIHAYRYRYLYDHRCIYTLNDSIGSFLTSSTDSLSWS